MYVPHFFHLVWSQEMVEKPRTGENTTSPRRCCQSSQSRGYQRVRGNWILFRRYEEQSTGVSLFHLIYSNIFCLLGRYVFDLAFSNVIKVAATCHPSFLRVPEDHQKLLQLSEAPLLINAAEIDQQYPIESQLKGDKILGGGKYKPGYKRMFDLLFSSVFSFLCIDFADITIWRFWAGTTHGFAVSSHLFAVASAYLTNH